jgi:hypothetical protein
MTVRVYKWTDAGAPVLTGLPGSLISLLDACLVTGYGTKAAAGWSKVAGSTTTVAAFQMPSWPSNCVRIDNATNAPSVTAYESMSSASVGDNRYPSATVIYCTVSNTANEIPREWTLVSGGNIFYLFTNHISTISGGALFTFGQILSYKSNDIGACILGGDHVTGGASTLLTINTLSTTPSTSYGKHMARSHTQAVGQIMPLWITDTSKNGAATSFGAGGMPFPSPVDNSVHMCPIWVSEATALRGEMPGLFNPLHSRPIAHNATFTGGGSLAGRSFLSLHCGSTSSFFIEVSDTW